MPYEGGPSDPRGGVVKLRARRGALEHWILSFSWSEVGVYILETLIYAIEKILLFCERFSTFSHRSYNAFKDISETNK